MSAARKLRSSNFRLPLLRNSAPFFGLCQRTLRELGAQSGAQLYAHLRLLRCWIRQFHVTGRSRVDGRSPHVDISGRHASHDTIQIPKLTVEYRIKSKSCTPWCHIPASIPGAAKPGQRDHLGLTPLRHDFTTLAFPLNLPPSLGFWPAWTDKRYLVLLQYGCFTTTVAVRLTNPGLAI